MIPQIHPPHATEGVSPGSQQTGNPHRPTPLSVADLFGLGFVLILTLLVSRQLIVSLSARYQLQRFIASLQRMATLERQLHRRPSQAVLAKKLSR